MATFTAVEVSYIQHSKIKNTLLDNKDKNIQEQGGISKKTHPVNSQQTRAHVRLVWISWQEVTVQESVKKVIEIRDNKVTDFKRVNEGIQKDEGRVDAQSHWESSAIHKQKEPFLELKKLLQGLNFWHCSTHIPCDWHGREVENNLKFFINSIGCP